MKQEPLTRLLAQLQNPPEEFTPVPFWFFNDRPDEEKIAQELKDYKQKGVDAFVLHPRIGIPEDVPYLSDAYFQAVRFIVKCADSLGMKVVLYDEGMYPSGSAHGMVVAQNPDYASRGIILSERPEGGEVITEFSDGKYLVYGFTGGTIRGIHFGEDDGEAGAPKSADILNPDAVDAFIRLTHDRYYEELKEYFGTTVIAFFTDEPCALGRNAAAFREWVPGLERELAAEGGKLPELEGLFTGEKNETTAIYHRLIKKHLRETFYARLSRWCEAHGIALMGHPEASDDVEEELYFQIPGQDLIMRRVSPETGGLLEFDSVQAKLCADIARHLGRRRNANECFGVCSRWPYAWRFTGRDMVWYINWLSIRGVNLLVPHAFYYSTAGKRKEERPPDVGPNNIWWPHYRRISDYIKRLSFLMTDSVNGARIAVLCDNNRVPYREVACLYENQMEFNYLPVALLPECGVKGGRLCIREYAYDAVLDVWGLLKEPLSGVRVLHSAQELLGEQTGAFEKAASNAEPGAPGMEKASSGTEKASSGAEAGRASFGFRTVRTAAPCPGLRAVRLKKEGTEMYLFSNEGEDTIRTEVTLPQQGKLLQRGERLQQEGILQQEALLLVDLWSGRTERAASRQTEQGTVFPLMLPACHVLLAVVKPSDEKNGESKAAEAERFPLQKLQEPEDWTERFALEERTDNRAVYGYRFTKETTEASERFLVRGEEMAECFCNGKPAGVSFFGPHVFEIGSFLKGGENEINEVKLVFTGSAANVYENAGIPFGLEEA